MYNTPRNSDIFGPSAIGGRCSESRERQLYQQGEGFGSFISSIFKKIVPLAAKTIKNVAGSRIVKDTGKQLADSAITGLANVASDVIGGEKTLDQSFSDQLSNARKEISTAIKTSNKKRKIPKGDKTAKNIASKKRKSRSKTSIKRRKIKGSIFDDEYD